MLIKSTNLFKAYLMDFFQVMKLIVEYLFKEDLAALKLTDVANRFKTAFDTLDAAVKQEQKSGFTEQKNTVDSLRDNTLTGIIGTVRYAQYFPDEEVAEAARLLLIVLEKYGKDIQKLPRKEETGIIHNIVQDLRNATNAPLIAKVSSLPWVDKLDEHNKKYEELHISQTEEQSAIVTGLAQAERDNTQKVFEELCRAIDSFAYVYGSAPYTPLAEKINTEVARVQACQVTRHTGEK